MHGKILGIPFVMNCQDARESLSTLLDGDIGLTERVPLELHVNTCVECGQKLADLQALRLVADRPAPRPVHHWHWPPVLAADAVGRALGLMRPDDVATRMRRLVIDRFPPRHLAIAAVVPLMAILAIFVFERGFKVGEAMRQRAASSPAVVAQGPPTPAAPRAVGVEPAVPAPAPAAAPPALPPRPVAQPRPSAASADAPKPGQTKTLETKPADTRSATRSAPTDTGAKPAKPVASAAATPVKAPPPAAAPGAVGKTVAAAVPPATARSAVDVVGRLRVKSRSEAEREIGVLVARAGGSFVSRQRGPTTTVVEASVPHASYVVFAQGVARIGSWQIEAERSPLPDLVKVTVRLAE